LPALNHGFLFEIFSRCNDKNGDERVHIYTARFCPYCASAKALLKRKGIAFAEIDIGGNWERRDEMIERANGRVTVPQIFIGTIHVGGNDELQTPERAGKLDQLITVVLPVVSRRRRCPLPPPRFHLMVFF